MYGRDQATPGARPMAARARGAERRIFVAAVASTRMPQRWRTGSASVEHRVARVLTDAHEREGRTAAPRCQ